MKPHKYQKKILEQQLTSQKKCNKVNLIKVTRRIAVCDFKRSKIRYGDSVYFRGASSGLEHFASDLYFELGRELVDDHIATTYYSLYLNYIEKLKKNYEKAQYIKMNYTPLESDLFEI